MQQFEPFEYTGGRSVLWDRYGDRSAAGRRAGTGAGNPEHGRLMQSACPWDSRNATSPWQD